jgi:vancomycin resistance protein YoaR
LLVVAAAGVIGAGLWLSRAEAGKLPPGVVIGGLDVGGKPVAEARALLERVTGERLERPIAIVNGTARITTTPFELGADARVERLLEQAGESRGRLSRLWARLGFAEQVEIPIRFAVRPKRVRAVVARVAGEVDQRMRPAGIGLLDGEVVVSPGQPGREVDRSTLFERLVLLPDSVELPLHEVSPAIPDDVAEQAKARADALVSSPPDVVYEDARVELPSGLVRDALRFRVDNGAITVSLAPAVLGEHLQEGFAQLVSKPRDARFRLDGDEVTIVPGRNGRVLDVALTVKGVTASADAPEVVAVLEDREPVLTTAEAEAWQIREVVSTFTTEFSCCQPRVTNIQKGARILDGVVVPPGEEFSLNDALGERTAERGFVEAPMIGAGGRLVDAVGGGVSQIATTVFNAAFFAGVELVQHTPHAFYISRYPMGREATVSWGGPELVFRNDWPAGILIDTETTDTAITVRFFSAKLGRRVRTGTGEPFGYRSAQTRYILNPALPRGSSRVVQSGGIEGFSVRYWRKVFRDGELKRDERFTTHYIPEDTIVEVGPKKRKPKPPVEPVPAETVPAESVPVETG